MTRNSWATIRRKARSPEDIAAGEQFAAAMRDAIALGQLREARGLRQVEVAQRMGTDQGSVSRLERREDLYLSTLRDYVEALGGELHLVARFPDGDDVTLSPALGDEQAAVYEATSAPA